MGRLLVLLSLIVLGFLTYWFSGKEYQMVLSHLYDDYTKNNTATGLLLGSSTLAYIDEEYLPSCIIWRNRAVGNSQISHTQSYLRFSPPRDDVEKVVLYVGENDIANGMTSEDAFVSFSALVSQLFEMNEAAEIYIILIKPSPVRNTFHESFNEFNGMVTRMAADEPALSVLDIVESTPATRVFGADGIHLNARGYMKLHFELTKVCND